MPSPSGPTTALRCPRCGSSFDCAAKTGGCWCGALRLDSELRGQLAAQYEGCLCPNCLRQLAPQR